MASVRSRFSNAWNIFMEKETVESDFYAQQGTSMFSGTQNPSRVRVSARNERSMLTAVANRIAMDVAAFDIEHVKIDDNKQYLETIRSDLNNCLRVEANKDQTGRVLIQDIVMSMFDEGVVAVIPVETSINPLRTDSYNILSLRTGKNRRLVS